MRHKATSMILEVREPLLAALGSLAGHSSKILASWRKLLRHTRMCGKHVSLLSSLKLGPHARESIFANPDAYREKCERQGEELASGGVPPECVAVALTLYLE